MTKVTEIKTIIKNNRQALILGRAGTGKSSTIMAVAEEMEMPVEILTLAGIPPEDLAGLIRPSDNKLSYTYLAPEWFTKHLGKPFILFLDEINQASIETLHALFYVVNDRRVAGLTNPEMRIIAAGNTADENEFLTPLPTPLRDRFIYKLNWSGDLKKSIKYLKNKYKEHSVTKRLLNVIDKIGEATPRHAEQALLMAIDGLLDVERGRELIGSAFDVWLKDIDKVREVDDTRINFLEHVKKKLTSKFVVVDGKMVACNHEKLISQLTEEEKELLEI